MIVSYIKSNDTIARVTGIYQGSVGEIVGDHQESNASFPIQEIIPNMEAVLMINLQTDTLYYDYIAVESVVLRLAEAEARNTKLAEESNANQLALMELHMMLLTLMPDAG